MTSQRELESLLVEFLDEGPELAADRVIDGALALIDNNSVARPLAAPRRLPSMNVFRPPRDGGRLRAARRRRGLVLQ